MTTNEIKLRAWDTVNEVMIYSDKDDAVFTLEKGEWHVRYTAERNFPASEDGPERDVEVWEESDDVEVMRFMGLLNDGSEIFEGDLVQSVYEFEANQISEIVYEAPMFLLKDIKTGNCFQILSLAHLKKIGNIHENPLETL